MKRFGSALLLTLVLAFGPACAVGLAPTVATLVQQRNAKDCLIATVAMLGSWSYEEVEETRLTLKLEYETHGFTVENALKIMDALGKPGKYQPPPSLGNVPAQSGILIVSEPGQLSAHAVVIDPRGLIYDPAMPYAMSWVLWFRDRPDAWLDGIVVKR